MRPHTLYNSIIFILISFASCKNIRQEDSNEISMNQITTDYDSLIQRVTTKGDTSAYSELFYGFIDSNDTESTDSVLRYSRIMAENLNMKEPITTT